MAIVTYQTYFTNTTYIQCWIMYYLKEFLKTVGWTVAGSSNGTTGSMDGVDRITSGTAFATVDTSWVVLQSPHAAGSRVQILFSPTLSLTTNGGTNVLIFYNPNADYVGTTTARPTSAYSTVLSGTHYFNLTTGTSGQTSTWTRLTFLADNATPYGWAMAVTTYNNPAQLQNLTALIPLDIRNDVNPGKPYVFYSSGALTVDNAYTNVGKTPSLSAGNYSRCVFEPRDPPKAPVWVAAACFANSSGVVKIPYGLNNPGGIDLQFPVVCLNNSEFAGVSSFAQWLGTYRTNLDTLSVGSTAKARIVMGALTFPWDGVTTPTP